MLPMYALDVDGETEHMLLDAHTCLQSSHMLTDTWLQTHADRRVYNSNITGCYYPAAVTPQHIRTYCTLVIG
jgi:hypothetical protein